MGSPTLLSRRSAMENRNKKNEEEKMDLVDVPSGDNIPSEVENKLLVEISTLDADRQHSN